MASRPRIIVAVPDAAECAAIAEWLTADGFDAVRHAGARSATEDIQTHRFDLLVADAAFAFRDGLHAAGRARAPQAPTIVIGDASAAKRCEAEGPRAMYVARPIDRAILACTVSMAILEGRPIRRSVRKAVDRFDAIANGVRCYLVDVSNEGLRLEIPRQRGSAPPPYFNVSLPLVGLTVTVQRMWTRACPANGAAEATWCGGALANNHVRAERAWRTFVETISGPGGAPRSIQIQ